MSYQINISMKPIKSCVEFSIKKTISRSSSNVIQVTASARLLSEI
jgi:hypothetical protein